jgi:hypothetical protein
MLHESVLNNSWHMTGSNIGSIVVTGHTGQMLLFPPHSILMELHSNVQETEQYK